MAKLIGIGRLQDLRGDTTQSLPRYVLRIDLRCEKYTLESLLSDSMYVGTDGSATRSDPDFEKLETDSPALQGHFSRLSSVRHSEFHDSIVALAWLAQRTSPHPSRPYLICVWAGDRAACMQHQQTTRSYSSVQEAARLPSNRSPTLSPTLTLACRMSSNIHVSSHPCARAKLSQLRSASTNAKDTQSLIHDIATIVGCEAFAHGLQVEQTGTVSSPSVSSARLG